MQLAANPSMAPFVKFDYVLREIAASMDLDEDYILNDPREAALQAKLMAEMAAIMPQPEPAPQQVPQAPDPTNNGGGQAVPGNAPEPGAPGFTGAGGGDNGGNPPPEAPPQGPAQ